LSLTGFGEDESSRWWLTGVEWLWKSRSDEKGKGGKRFKGVERQEILDLVNREILPPEDTSGATTGEAENGDDGPKEVDAPLVRLVNFIRKLTRPICCQS
jgi:mediator of RNA polymerase II transcription subunit 14